MPGSYSHIISKNEWLNLTVEKAAMCVSIYSKFPQ